MKLTRFVLAATAMATLAAGVLAGCATPGVPGSSDLAPAEVSARPEALDGLPQVRLLAPGGQDAGLSPVFSWDPVDRAASYLLTLIDGNGPLWSWQGDQTSVRLGGYSTEPAPGAGALRLQQPGWWTVSAYSTSGELLAISDARSVSPDARRPSPAAPSEATAPAPVPSAQPEPLDVCSLLTEKEVTDHFGGDLAGEPKGSTERNGQYLDCEWEAAHSEFATLRVSVSLGATKERWDEDIAVIKESYPDFTTGVPGLGEDSYVDSGWGVSVRVYRESVYYAISSGMSAEYEAEVIQLAVLAIERFEARQGG